MPGACSGRSPSYVLTNYIVVPLGLDKDGNAVVARLPPDETGKQLGGVIQSWLAEDRTVWQAIVDTVDYTSSQLPSLTPLAKVPLDLLAYASGQNVEDTYRRRDVLTKTEQDAREADTWAWEPLKKFTGYEFQQMAPRSRLEAVRRRRPAHHAKKRCGRPFWISSCPRRRPLWISGAARTSWAAL